MSDIETEKLGDGWDTEGPGSVSKSVYDKERDKAYNKLQKETAKNNKAYTNAKNSSKDTSKIEKAQNNVVNKYDSTIDKINDREAYDRNKLTNPEKSELNNYKKEGLTKREQNRQTDKERKQFREAGHTFEELEDAARQDNADYDKMSISDKKRAVNESRRKILKKEADAKAEAETNARQQAKRWSFQRAINEQERAKINDTVKDNVRDNLSVGAIFNSGFDWVTNHFAAYLTIEEGDLNPFKIFNNEAYKSSVLTQEGFMVRFGKMTVPSLRNDVFELKIGERTIKKLRSTKQMTRQLSYTFRLDDPLEWLHWYNQLSGIYNTNSKSRYIANSHKQSRKLNIYIQQLGGGYDYCKGNKQESILKFPKLPFSFNSSEPKELQIQQILKNDKFQFFKIEDVKILGVSDIEFSVDNSEAKEITVDFVFKTIQRLRGENFLINP